MTKQSLKGWWTCRDVARDVMVMRHENEIQASR